MHFFSLKIDSQVRRYRKEKRKVIVYFSDIAEKINVSHISLGSCYTLNNEFCPHIRLLFILVLYLLKKILDAVLFI